MKQKYILKKTFLSAAVLGLAAAGLLAPTEAQATPSSGKAVSGNLVVRDAPSGEYAAELEKGQTVTITDETQGSDGQVWYAVTLEYEGETVNGWVRSDLLDTTDSEEIPGTESNSDANSNGEADPTDGQTDPAGNTDDANTGNNADEANTDGNADGVLTDLTFTVKDKTYAISTAMPTDKLPDGCTESSVTYKGTEVPAARVNDTDTCLLYLQNTADASDADFFVLDAERDTVTPLIRLSCGDGYVTLIDVPMELAASVSERYTETSCQFEAGGLMAYQASEADELVDPDASFSDFYYVYGISDQGESGWYVYDAANGTIQRSSVNMQYAPGAAAEEAAAETPAASLLSGFNLDSLSNMLIAALGVLCLILLIVAIAFSVRYRRLRNLVDDNDDWEDEAETKKKSRKEKKKAAAAAEKVTADEQPEIAEQETAVERPETEPDKTQESELQETVPVFLAAQLPSEHSPEEPEETDVRIWEKGQELPASDEPILIEETQEEIPEDEVLYLPDVTDAETDAEETEAPSDENSDGTIALPGAVTEETAESEEEAADDSESAEPAQEPEASEEQPAGDESAEDSTDETAQAAAETIIPPEKRAPGKLVEVSLPDSVADILDLDKEFEGLDELSDEFFADFDEDANLSDDGDSGKEPEYYDDPNDDDDLEFL